MTTKRTLTAKLLDAEARSFGWIMEQDWPLEEKKDALKAQWCILTRSYTEDESPFYRTLYGYYRTLMIELEMSDDPVFHDW